MKKLFMVIWLISLLGSSLIGKQNVFLVTIPKCGAHAAIKMLQSMGSYPRWINEFAFINVNSKRLEVELQRGTEIFCHAVPTPEIFDLLEKYNYAVIFVFRDPRAYLASLAHHIKSKAVYTLAKKYTIQELISDLMHKGHCQKNAALDIYYPSERGVVSVFNTYFKWLDSPNVLAIRYEELVGEFGGGSSEAQKEIIIKMAQHIGLATPTDEQIKKITNRLLYNRHYEFRKGTIDSWKDDFSQKLLEEFHNLNDQLISHLCWG